MEGPVNHTQLSAGHKELGEFSAHVVGSLYKTSDFSSDLVTPENLKSYCAARYLVSGMAIDFGIKHTYLTAVILADKFHNDHRYSNKSWAEMIEIPFDVVNFMELTFLKCLNFQIYINGDEFASWIDFLFEFIKAQQLLFMDPPPPQYIDPVKTDIKNISKSIIKNKKISPLEIIEYLSQKEKLKPIAQWSYKYPPGLGYTSPTIFKSV
ncbi:hypothetical protein Glove_295g54 [Diversispora epigaea]|uniref:Cyclin N-terminal domain-containing protein n=1 Tax=Diversispora epigaea TaxID=1348612 RepID=A0A397HYW2_9GLOM|nr:hypothetical protein Glove_295g54 [Diversispora epigaea]